VLTAFLFGGFSGLSCPRAPGSSTLEVWSKWLELKIYEEVFCKILSIVDRHGLLKCEVLEVDSTTLEANAAMRSIVRKDTGESYRKYLVGLAGEAGIEDPTPDKKLNDLLCLSLEFL
jgi:transposase